MINVYVKSFNRPFYLDRCIRSVKFNVTGYSKIIVLDDGTPSAFMDRIRQLHPDVEIRSSSADDGKVELLRQERFKEIEKLYPSAPDFWVREVKSDDNAYCLILEDDAWIVRRLDLLTLVRNLESNQAVICKLWWSNHVHKITERYICNSGPALEYYDPDYESSKDASSIWIVAFALFRRDYWLHCVSKARRLADERSQLIAAADFANRHPTARFAKTERRVVHQGWMIPARSTPEYYDKGLVQHLYMDALNGAWAAGRLDSAEGYPFDFSKPAVAAILREALPEKVVGVWGEWHEREIRYYYD
ncbi:hypothetical protein NKH45_23280 [Mesorhizobium sp. M1156]|uniref:hypothetical protein n=1 Tax=unclassified Mesorhizobium TaxID=325217 RepID=UPI00333CBA25